MKDMITGADKKQFIKWFLEHYELKNPEAEWLLQYLYSSEQLLAKVHFTEHFRSSPKALLMSTTCVQMTAFKFYKNKRVTSDVEKAFLDVHSHPEEDIYVTLYFNGRNTCSRYLAILEQADDRAQTVTGTEALIALQAELVLDQIEREWRRERYDREIDAALVTGDRAAFLRLTAEYAKFVDARQ
ncbi:MAG: YpiB family protein [Bacilli bacterium]